MERYQVIHLWFPLTIGHTRRMARLHRMALKWERDGLLHPRDFQMPEGDEDFEE